MAPTAAVVGGSIAGLSCAHALIRAGWRVTVVEKSAGISTAAALTGAGLGLDPQSLSLLRTWISQPSLLESLTIGLRIDENRATDPEIMMSRILTRDRSFGFRAAHWRDVHALLYGSLGDGVVLWGHQFLNLVDFHEDTAGAPVRMAVKVLATGDTVEIAADMLVGADGCLSAVRRCFLPDHKLRYSGYSAWRGVFDFSGTEEPETITALRDAYPDLGDCLYFDLSYRTHCVVYELQQQRINWIWYVNQTEPQLKANSVTMKVDNEMIKRMHEEAEKIWTPELVNIIRETKEPFLNVIYDSEPLPQLVWGNVVLVGDAAHATTPHGLRSTNMSILDAEILAQCVQKWKLKQLQFALEEFQSLRLPVVSEQVLFSRYLGRLKQGLALDGMHFDPIAASSQECDALRQRNMPFFHGVSTAT